MRLEDENMIGYSEVLAWNAEHKFRIENHQKHTSQRQRKA